MRYTVGTQAHRGLATTVVLGFLGVLDFLMPFFSFFSNHDQSLKIRVVRLLQGDPTVHA
jgi:hypothetical protein